MKKKRFRWIRPTVIDIRREMPPILCSDREQGKRYLEFLNSREDEIRKWKKKYFEAGDLLIKNSTVIDKIHDICVLSNGETAKTILKILEEDGI